MAGESWEGSANKPTHRFKMHWKADQGLYDTVRDFAYTRLVEEPEITDRDLGRAVVEYVGKTVLPTADPQFARVVDADIVFWGQIDWAEVGADVRDHMDDMLRGTDW